MSQIAEAKRDNIPTLFTFAIHVTIARLKSF